MTSACGIILKLLPNKLLLNLGLESSLGQELKGLILVLLILISLTAGVEIRPRLHIQNSNGRFSYQQAVAVFCLGRLQNLVILVLSSKNGTSVGLEGLSNLLQLLELEGFAYFERILVLM